MRKFLSCLLALVLLCPLLSAFPPARAEESLPGFYGTSLYLENNIAINCLVSAGDLIQGGYTAPEVTFQFRGEVTTEKSYAVKGGYYYFTFHDIAPLYLGEEVEATLSVEKDGVRLVGETARQSVLSYCTDLREQCGGEGEICALIASLLNYGAKSQAYFGYTGEQAITVDDETAQLIPAAEEPVSVKDAAYKTVDDPEVTWYGANLKLEDSVTLQFFFTAPSVDHLRIDVKTGDGELLASYYRENMETVGAYRRIRCREITPDKMGEALFVTAYRTTDDLFPGEGELPVVGVDAPVSNTLRYSIASYAADVIVQENDPKLTELIFAVLRYSRAVENYVAASPARVVETPLSRAALDALPVARSSMTNAQLRQIVLDYYVLQGTVPWTIADPVQYNYTRGQEPDDGIEFVKGQVYGGLPYSYANMGLYQFFDYYDEKTGVLNNPYGSDLGRYIGNHCCSSVYWAWARVSSTISFLSTDFMNPAHGAIPVGNYVIRDGVTHFDKSYNTVTVCAENGLDVMSAAYAELLPADAVVAFDRDAETDVVRRHHARLVKEVNVVKTGDEIDPDGSTVTFYEQDNTFNNYDSHGQIIKKIGNFGRVVTFRKLFEDGYIPVTCKELAGQAPVAAASAALSAAPASPVTPASVGERSLKTNYCIAKLTMTAKDARVRDVASVWAHGQGNNTGKGNAFSAFPLKDLAAGLDSQLAAGSYVLEISVLLSNGETKTAYRHSFIKE